MVSLASALKLSRGVRFRNEGHSPQGMLRSLAGTAPREAGRVSSSTQTGVTSMKLITSWCAIVADVQWEKRLPFHAWSLGGALLLVFSLTQPPMAEDRQPAARVESLMQSSLRTPLILKIDPPVEIRRRLLDAFAESTPGRALAVLDWEGMGRWFLCRTANSGCGSPDDWAG